MGLVSTPGLRHQVKKPTSPSFLPILTKLDVSLGLDFFRVESLERLQLVFTLHPSLRKMTMIVYFARHCDRYKVSLHDSIFPISPSPFSQPTSDAPSARSFVNPCSYCGAKEGLDNIASC